MKALIFSSLLVVLSGAGLIAGSTDRPEVISDQETSDVRSTPSDTGAKDWPEPLGNPTPMNVCDGWAVQQAGGGWCCGYEKPKKPAGKIISSPPNTIACNPPNWISEGDTFWCCAPPLKR